MARLYFTGDNPNLVAATFRREGDLAGKRCLRHMRAAAKLVMEYSRRGAPVDHKGPGGAAPKHELEKSHRIEEQYNNRRIEATVIVGGMVGTVNVDDYLDFIHFGRYALGEASIAKQAADPQVRVGPYFLDRALEEYESEFEDWADDVMGDLMGALMR
jgi:hypothetical protein